MDGGQPGAPGVRGLAALGRPTRVGDRSLGATLAEANGSAQTVPTEPAYEVSDLREEGSGPADFDFEVSLHEEIADEELVDEVAAGLRAAAGVLEVHVEDREVLLVRAPDWDEHRLVRCLDGNLRRP